MTAWSTAPAPLPPESPPSWEVLTRCTMLGGKPSELLRCRLCRRSLYVHEGERPDRCRYCGLSAPAAPRVVEADLEDVTPADVGPAAVWP